MGGFKAAWADRVNNLKPSQIPSGLMNASGNPVVRFMHCLSDWHDSTRSKRQWSQHLHERRRERLWRSLGVVKERSALLHNSSHYEGPG